MKTSLLPPFFLFIVFFLLYTALASQPFTFFEYPKGKNARVYTMSNFDEEETMLLLFKYSTHFDLVFLDDDMGLRRKISTPNFPSIHQGRSIQAIINVEHEMYVFIEGATSENKYQSLVYKIDKDDGSYDARPVLVHDDYRANLEKKRSKLLKVFQYGTRFYKVWVDVKSSELLVFYYNAQDESDTGFEIISLQQAGLAKHLGRKTTIPIPVITHPLDANLVSNAKTEKIYMFGTEMIISVENPETGRTELLVIDTESWELQVEFYPAMGFQPGEMTQQFNSFIYNDALFQIVFNPSGLTLSKFDFQAGEIVNSQHWDNKEEFYQDFKFKRKRQYRGDRLEVREDPELWRHFGHSIAVIIHPHEEYERLMIGSHRYMEPNERALVNTLGILASVAAEAAAGGLIASTGNGPNFLAADAFGTAGYVIDAAVLLRDGRMFQGDTYFNSETFRTSSERVSGSKWDEVLKRINDEELSNQTRSVSLFEHNGEIYFGYWRRKKYYLVRF